MNHIKIFENFLEDITILSVGTKIKFAGNDCEIIQHKASINNEVFYLIRYKDGSEEFIVPRDKRIEQYN